MCTLLASSGSNRAEAELWAVELDGGLINVSLADLRNRRAQYARKVVRRMRPNRTAWPYKPSRFMEVDKSSGLWNK
jgi:hypothetical protein